MFIGVDYHPSFQTIAFFMEETGEYGERELKHSDGEAERFYRDLMRSGGAPVQSLCLSERVVLASRPRFLFANRTRLPFAGAACPAAQKIEFVFSCQSRNLSTGAAGAHAPAPSRFNGKTWQASRCKNPSALA